MPACHHLANSRQHCLALPSGLLALSLACRFGNGLPIMPCQALALPITWLHRPWPCLQPCHHCPSTIIISILRLRRLVDVLVTLSSSGLASSGLSANLTASSPAFVDRPSLQIACLLLALPCRRLVGCLALRRSLAFSLAITARLACPLHLRTSFGLTSAAHALPHACLGLPMPCLVSLALAFHLHHHLRRPLSCLRRPIVMPFLRRPSWPSLPVQALSFQTRRLAPCRPACPPIAICCDVCLALLGLVVALALRPAFFLASLSFGLAFIIGLPFRLPSSSSYSLLIAHRRNCLCLRPRLARHRRRRQTSSSSDVRLGSDVMPSPSSSSFALTDVQIPPSAFGMPCHACARHLLV